MKRSNSFLTLGLTLACAAFTLSLAVCAQAQTVTFLSKVIAPTGVVQATDGNYYGVSGGGGAHGVGQVFRMTPAGEVTVIYSFCSLPNCADGEYPGPAPILGSDGKLYGVTNGGNSNSSGTFYGLTGTTSVTFDGMPAEFKVQ